MHRIGGVMDRIGGVMDHIGGAMNSVVATSAVDHGLGPWKNWFVEIVKYWFNLFHSFI